MTCEENKTVIEIIKAMGPRTIVLEDTDCYTNTKGFCRNLYKKIFGTEVPENMTFNYKSIVVSLDVRDTIAAYQCNHFDAYENYYTGCPFSISTDLKEYSVSLWFGWVMEKEEEYVSTLDEE